MLHPQVTHLKVSIWHQKGVDEAVEQGINKFLISSEHLYSRLKSESEIAALADYLHQNFKEVRVIFGLVNKSNLKVHILRLSGLVKAQQLRIFKDNFRLESLYLNFDLGLRFWETYLEEKQLPSKYMSKKL